MNRRGFLGSVLALAAAPAIVRASSLMKVRQIIVPSVHILYGDGIRDDTVALQAALNGKQVFYPDGQLVNGLLRSRSFLIAQTVIVYGDGELWIDNCNFEKAPDFRGDSMILFDSADSVCVFSNNSVVERKP